MDWRNLAHLFSCISVLGVPRKSSKDKPLATNVPIFLFSDPAFDIVRCSFPNQLPVSPFAKASAANPCLQEFATSDVVILGWNRFRNQIFIIISEVEGSNSYSDSIKKWKYNIYQDAMILGLEPIPILFSLWLLFQSTSKNGITTSLFATTTLKRFNLCNVALCCRRHAAVRWGNGTAAGCFTTPTWNPFWKLGKECVQQMMLCYLTLNAQSITPNLGHPAANGIQPADPNHPTVQRAMAIARTAGSKAWKR